MDTPIWTHLYGHAYTSTNNEKNLDYFNQKYSSYRKNAYADAVSFPLLSCSPSVSLSVTSESDNKEIVTVVLL